MRHRISRGEVGESTASKVDEARISATQRELQQEFPSVQPAEIDTLVEGWQHYEAARIRDFVPLLVRKQAVEELRELVPVSPGFSSGCPEPPSMPPLPRGGSAGKDRLSRPTTG